MAALVIVNTVKSKSKLKGRKIAITTDGTLLTWKWTYLSENPSSLVASYAPTSKAPRL